MGVTLRIGIDLGGTKVEAAVIDRAGGIRARRRIATPVGDYDRTIAALVGLVAAIEREVGVCASVGVGIHYKDWEYRHEAERGGFRPEWGRD